jgi:hypothetical protein
VSTESELGPRRIVEDQAAKVLARRLGARRCRRILWTVADGDSGAGFFPYVAVSCRWVCGFLQRARIRLATETLSETYGVDPGRNNGRGRTIVHHLTKKTHGVDGGGHPARNSDSAGCGCDSHPAHQPPIARATKNVRVGWQATRKLFALPHDHRPRFSLTPTIARRGSMKTVA